MANNSPFIFLGCDIEILKFVEIPPENSKIVVSTCYFLDSLLNISPRIFNYVSSLIENIESFQYKINAFTTKNQNVWTYRVYIDNILWSLPDVLEHKPLFSELNLSNARLAEINVNIDNNKKILLFICKFIQAYIEFIISSKDDKYKNIEIYTYKNEKTLTHLKSDPTKVVSGHYDTFGTLMRFHPLVEDGNAVCIMRNCSDNFTPLDIAIQDFWINYKPDDYYMEYYGSKYKFNPTVNFKIKKLLRLLYKEEHNNLKVPLIFLFKRSYAGLISSRINSTLKNLFLRRFRLLKKRLIDTEFKIPNNNEVFSEKNTKFIYGIDEIIIPFIIPEFSDLHMLNTPQSPPQSPPKTYRVHIDPIAPSTEYNFEDHPIVKALVKINCNVKELLRAIGLFFIPDLYNVVLPDKYSSIHNILSRNLFAESAISIDFEGLNYLLKSFEWLKKPFFVLSYTNSDGKQITSNEVFVNALKTQCSSINLENNIYFSYNLINLDLGIDIAIAKILDLISLQYTSDNFQPLLLIPKKIKINYTDDTEDSKTIIRFLSSRAIPLQTGGKYKILLNKNFYKKTLTKKQIKQINHNKKSKRIKHF